MCSGMNICSPLLCLGQPDQISGTQKCYLVTVMPFKTAGSQILKILSGKVVVGHAIHNDYKALQYFYPKFLTWDTSQIPQLNWKADYSENVTLSLKHPTKKLLIRDIQPGKSWHSLLKDVQATMELYKLVEVDRNSTWPRILQKNYSPRETHVVDQPTLLPAFFL